MSPGSSTYRGPRDSERREQWRTARRGVVRRHHPDLGGDPQVLQERLDDLDRTFRRLEEVPLQPGVETASRTTLTQAARTARRVVRTGVRAARARLPRGWPGHRRYVEL